MKKKSKQQVPKEEMLMHVLTRLDKRFNTWYRILWYGMLQGAGAVLGAALLVLILGFILHLLGFEEWSQAIKLYGRYGKL